MQQIHRINIFFAKNSLLLLNKCRCRFKNRVVYVISLTSFSPTNSNHFLKLSGLSLKLSLLSIQLVSSLNSNSNWDSILSDEEMNFKRVGKSTLMRIISDKQDLDQGEVFL